MAKNKKFTFAVPSTFQVTVEARSEREARQELARLDASQVYLPAPARVDTYTTMLFFVGAPLLRGKDE